MLKLPVKSPIVNGDIDLSEYAKKSDVDAIDASLDNKADKKEVEKISSQLDNSNAEVAAARNGFETLGKRLDGVDSQLDTKVDLNTFKNALEDEIVLGDNDTFLKALVNGSCTVTFWGDSITQGADFINDDMKYFEKYKNILKNNFKDTAFYFYNHGIAGRNIEQAIDENYKSPTDFNTEWSTIDGKAWRNYVKDSKPDLLIVAFGMNGQGASLYGATAFAELDLFIQTFEKKPTVIIIPTWLPRKEWDNGEPYRKALEAQRYTRDYTKELTNYNIFDIGNKYQKYVGGINENILNTSMKWEFSAWELEDGTDIEYANNSTTLSNKRLKTKEEYLNFKVSFVATFTNTSKLKIEFRHGYSVNLTNSGVLTLEHYPNGNPLKSVTITSMPSEISISVEMINSRIKVIINNNTYIDDLFFCSYYPNYIFIGNEINNITVKNFTTHNFKQQETQKLIEVDAICGNYENGNYSTKYPYGGNGVNHPTDFALNFLYVPFMEKFIEKIKMLYEKRRTYLFPISIKSSQLSTVGNDWGNNGQTNSGLPLLFTTTQGNYNKNQDIKCRRLDDSTYLTFRYCSGRDQLATLEENEFTIIKDGGIEMFWTCGSAIDLELWKVI